MNWESRQTRYKHAYNNVLVSSQPLSSLATAWWNDLFNTPTGDGSQVPVQGHGW